jgi:hypothetical protein
MRYRYTIAVLATIVGILFCLTVSSNSESRQLVNSEEVKSLRRRIFSRRLLAEKNLGRRKFSRRLLAETEKKREKEKEKKGEEDEDEDETRL